MYDPSDSDTQHDYALLQDIETQPRKSRVQQACRSCRNRKQRCDGSSPCKPCTDSEKLCEYESVPPAKRDQSFENLDKKVAETLRAVRAIAIHMKVPSTSLEGLSVAGPSRPKPLGVSQEIHVESFSSSRLRELAKAYIEDVHVLHPMFEEPWKMCEEFIENYSDSAATTGSIMSSLKNAIVLLLLALGSCKPISDGTKHPVVLPGIVYYSYAQTILASKRKKYDTSVAQAMTLAALYENQIGMLQKSYASVSYAYHIYTDLCNHAGFFRDASDIQKQNISFSEETKRSFWICQDLARGINACLSIVSADPVRTLGRDIFPGESPEEGPAMVLATRVLLRKTFDEVKKLAPAKDTAMGRIDEDDLVHLMSFANTQLEFLECWRSVLPSQLAWEDKELPSTDPLMASLRAEYYNNRVKLLRPYLEIIRNCEYFNVAVDRPSAGQRKLFGVALDWVNSALSSIIAFDRIGTRYDGTYETYRTTSRTSVMLSNPVETLHTEFENIIILGAIYSSAIYPLLVGRTQLTETSLNTLRLRAMDRLSKHWPKSPLLARDLAILRVLWPQGDFVALLDLAGILTGVSTH